MEDALNVPSPTMSDTGFREERFEFLLEQFEGLWLRMALLLEEGYTPTPLQSKRLENVVREMLRKAVDL